MTKTPPKTIKLPFLPQLEQLQSAGEVMSLLENEGTRRTISSLNWPKLYPYAPLTTFTAAHSGEAIYIDFFVRCNYLRAENYTNLSPVSQDSCVEFFVAPFSNELYYNFEFNCIGTINASHRTERHNPTRLSAKELSRIRVTSSCGNRPFKEMEGIFSWNLLIKIPLDLMGIEYNDNPITMRANFNKCASATSAPHYLSWNPINSEKPDFHRPEDFGILILE